MMNSKVSMKPSLSYCRTNSLRTQLKSKRLIASAQQLKDMVVRNVARKLSKDELTNHTGPTQYIAHHEVLNPESKSTPVHIVFNSSANIIRFRENRVAFIGGKGGNEQRTQTKCLIHDNGRHWTANCLLYQAKTREDNPLLVRDDR